LSEAIHLIQHLIDKGEGEVIVRMGFAAQMEEEIKKKAEDLEKRRDDS
jgi:hypothetical protein